MEALDTRWVYLRDLPETLHGELLLCPQCGEESSAQRGDYFWMGDRDPFWCGDCDEPLSLVKKVVHYVTIAGEEVD